MVKTGTVPAGRQRGLMMRVFEGPRGVVVFAVAKPKTITKSAFVRARDKNVFCPVHDPFTRHRVWPNISLARTSDLQSGSRGHGPRIHLFAANGGGE